MRIPGGDGILWAEPEHKEVQPMVEVVFEDSAAGSLRAGVGRPVQSGGGGHCALWSGKRGRTPSSPEEEAQLRAAERRRQQEEAQRQRQGWAESLPLPGQLRDILAFPLAHSVGEITEEGIGPQREAALRKVMGVYPFLAAEVAETCWPGGGRPTRLCWTGPARERPSGCGRGRDRTTPAAWPGWPTPFGRWGWRRSP